MRCSSGTSTSLQKDCRNDFCPASRFIPRNVFFSEHFRSFTSSCTFTSKKAFLERERCFVSSLLASFRKKLLMHFLEPRLHFNNPFWTSFIEFFFIQWCTYAGFHFAYFCTSVSSIYIQSLLSYFHKLQYAWVRSAPKVDARKQRTNITS